MIPFVAPRLVSGDTSIAMRANARHCRELYDRESDPEHRRRLSACIVAYREAAERAERDEHAIAAGSLPSGADLPARSALDPRDADDA